LYAFFTLRIGLSAVRLAKNLFMVILFFQTELLYHTVLYSSIRRFKGVGKVILGFLWATRVTSLLVQWCWPLEVPREIKGFTLYMIKGSRNEIIRGPIPYDNRSDRQREKGRRSKSNLSLSVLALAV
jgi:hypothetical protein